ncbi:MAG: hypothetical protein AAFR82_07005 [Pseudomonadota bacterium]
MLGTVFKALLGVAGAVSVGFGAWLMLDDAVLAEISFPRQLTSYTLLGSGGLLLLAAIWARARSLIGLIAVAGGTGLVSWVILYGDLNVWQLIPFWIAAFFGSFATLVCLIAVCRGKDVI